MVRTPDVLPPELLAVARAQEGLVDVSQCERAGVSRSRIARAAGAGRVTRVLPGVYDLCPTPLLDRTHDPDRARGDLFEHRRRRAAWRGLLAHGPAAVAVGQTALVLHGVQGLPAAPRIDIARVDRRPRAARQGVALRRFTSPRYFETIGDRLVVPVEHALAQAVPELDRMHAVAAMDSALYQRKVDATGLGRAHDLARGRRGVGKTHEWWDLADTRAESPAETRARLGFLDEGVPPDTLQQVFLGPGPDDRARVDLAWWLGRGRWLICEIDGHDAHSMTKALYRDRARQNNLVDAGHLVFRFTGREADAGVPARVLAPRLRSTGWRPDQAFPRGPFQL